jgi:hypothetical protein
LAEQQEQLLSDFRHCSASPQQMELSVLRH